MCQANLKCETTEQELRDHFDRAGEILKINPVKIEDKEKNKGKCLIELANEFTWKVLPFSSLLLIFIREHKRYMAAG